MEISTDATDQPNSLYPIESIEKDQMYMIPATEIILPFQLLPGETPFHNGSSVDGLIVITNYRLYLQSGDNHHHVPLGLIEMVDHRDFVYLYIGCKDARTYRCMFENNEKCLEWHGYLTKAGNGEQLEQVFAYYYFIWSKAKRTIDYDQRIRNLNNYIFDYKLFKDEMTRLQFGGDVWRISEVNKNYQLCPTYPPYLIVPSCISDDMLEAIAKFRSSRRIPAVVWRHVKNGAIIARCSQPEVGWLGWRSPEDEALVKAISEACTYYQKETVNDRDLMLSHSPNSLTSDDSLHITNDINVKEKKVLIMDARSYTTAVANRARGGGCECSEYYPNCDVQFMNLANIHSIRKSFHALRLLCTSSADQPNWLSQLENTRWLAHMSGLLKSAVTLVNAIEREERPVLVHCSDGWDRTPQIIALAELLLDPYYRTIDGFRILIEREWLAFGHKFADRCGQASGSDDQNERCPVFLQWLDCVHQVLKQFPCAFEFSHIYLVKLVQHIYSNLYGTFLCNTFQQRINLVNGRTMSVWEFLSTSRFKNHLYAPPGNSCGSKVLWPQCNVRDMQLWNEVYLGSWEASFTTESGSGSCPGPPESSPQHMTKTRSYGDLTNAAGVCPSQYRRNSDPSINIENKNLIDLTLEPQESAIQNGTAPPSRTAGDVSMKAGAVVVDYFLGNESDTDTCNNDCIFNYNRRMIPMIGTDADALLIDSAMINGTLGTTVPKCVRPSENGGVTAEVILENGTNFELSSLENGTCSDERLRLTLDEPFSLHRNGDFQEGALLEHLNHESNGLQNGFDKTDSAAVASDGNEVIHTDMCDGLQSICLTDGVAVVPVTSVSGLDSPDNDRSEGRSEATVERSIETSTDTLVSDNHNISSSPIEVNGFEKVRSPIETLSCRACLDSKKFDNDSHRKENGLGEPCSHQYSSTPSSGGWDNGLTHHRTLQTHPYTLGDDGLIPVRSVPQERLLQIIEDHKKQRDQLEKELHTYRQTLLKQCCHKCTAGETDKGDETFNTDSTEKTSSQWQESSSPSPHRISSPVLKLGSVADSVNSAGEGEASAVESLRSDLSWEALEENPLLECTGTLWVPDHAVSRCSGCQMEFWIGKRKHHCRKCGRIFCASCSENTTPLPSEQLYFPVRVCTGCYSKLRRDCAELPDQCKHTNGQPTNNNPQITASSN